MSRTYEVTRTELPVKEGHRGRKPCEWRVDGFLIPKHLTCKECEKDKATTKDGFMSGLQKSELSPQRYCSGYICRSCRVSMRDNDETVKIGRLNESKPVESEPRGVFATKTRGSYMSGLQIGMIVQHKPVVFYANEIEFEDHGFNFQVLRCATEVYELNNGRCFKHPSRDLTTQQKRDGIRKFRNVTEMYNFEDMEAVLRKMMNGGFGA